MASVPRAVSVCSLVSGNVSVCSRLYRLESLAVRIADWNALQHTILLHQEKPGGATAAAAADEAALEGEGKACAWQVSPYSG